MTSLKATAPLPADAAGAAHAADAADAADASAGADGAESLPVPAEGSPPSADADAVATSTDTSTTPSSEHVEAHESSVSLGRSARNTGPGKSAAHLDYLGTPLFYPRSSIEQAIKQSRRVQSVADQVAQEKYEQSKTAYEAQRAAHARVKGATKSFTVPAPRIETFKQQTSAQVDRIISGMVADMSSTRVVRFFGFVVHNLLSRMYHRGIHIREAEIERLRKVAQMAQEKKMSLVFLPCHKSHIDYLVISYVLYRLGFALPHIAAGDNLNMPLVGWLLRHNGAFFIRRQWGDDRLYSAIMKEYMETLLMRGHNIEAFVEGTRSRTGKPLQPKFGVLKIMMDAVWSGRVADAMIVPVSIGYDKVIETPSYADELLGTPKQKESLGQLLNSVNILGFKWGRIDVRFGEPFSLRDYIAHESSRRGFDAGIVARSEADEKVIVLQSLGYRVLGDVNKITVVMPTALVGTALLTLRGRGVGRNELIRKVKWIRKEILSKGGSVAEFGDVPLSVILDRAITVLGDLIGRRTDLLEPVYYPGKRFELSFYRNQVIHLFVAESIVSLAIYATIKAGGPIKAQRVPITPNLVDDVSFLSQLLKTEFVYESGGLGKNLPVTIAKLQQANVLAVGQFEGGESGPVGGKRWVTLSKEERRIGRENFDFYCFLIWPFVETYWLAAVSLYTILPHPGHPAGVPHWVDERLFLKRCQFFGRTLYSEGDISYFEAINKDTLANAVARLKEMGVVQTRKGPFPAMPASPIGAGPAGAPAEGGPAPATQSPDALPGASYAIPPAPAKDSAAGGSWISLKEAWIPKGELPLAELPLQQQQHHSSPQYQQFHHYQQQENEDVSSAAISLDNGSDHYARDNMERQRRGSVGPAAGAATEASRGSDQGSRWGGHMSGFTTFTSQHTGLIEPYGYNSASSSSGSSASREPDPYSEDITPQPSSSGNGNGNGNGKTAGGRMDELADDTDPDTMRLESWYNVQPSGRLWELCEQIGRFRREGKNRRDTNTVAIRVLRLARMASLWHDGKIVVPPQTAAAAAAATAPAADASANAAPRPVSAKL
ncbi:hypothetical protein BC831DRAFT_464859 [Entophlyctis helioformis]|nr:hypothetical protein BC831DRAFT_464859 [Entophlyctis helioformis]